VARASDRRAEKCVADLPPFTDPDSDAAFAKLEPLADRLLHHAERSRSIGIDDDIIGCNIARELLEAGHDEHEVAELIAEAGVDWRWRTADERLVARARERLKAVAEQEGRPVPQTGLHVFVHVEDGANGRDETAAFLRGQYQLPFEQVERYVAVGTAAEVTEHLAALAASGVDEFLLHPAAGDHHRQYDLLGEVLAGLRKGAPA